jgi:hypothetical protein
MGLVVPETSAETSTEKIGREAGVPEVIVGIQEKEGMVVEDLSREESEGVSVHTTGLKLPVKSTKKGEGQGADTQQLEGEEGMVHAEVEEGKTSESARGLPDKGTWTKERNVRRSDQDRTEKEDMEMENEVDGENVYSPKS